MKRIFVVMLMACGFVYASHEPVLKDWRLETEKADYIHRAMKQVTDVMVYDIYSPPVTSRTYAYISVAAYEVMIQNNPDYISLSRQLHGLNPIPKIDRKKQYSFTLAAVHALLTSGKHFVISEEKIDAFEAILLQEFKDKGIPDSVYENSIAYGQKVADHILAWADEDNFKKIQSMPDYRVKADAGSWKPTPPAYIKAIEPNWNKLRTFMIDSAEQYKPVAPPPFSIDTTSRFYGDVMAVYKKVKNNTPEENEIANFWDCNPFKMNLRGHVMFATKKISPNGHWMN
ncbi:hypothetical protein LCGC14_1508190, partial [marine sediment metagenome]